MELRPRKIIILIILHRLTQVVLGANDSTTEAARCVNLLCRASAFADTDPADWNGEQQAVGTALDALNTAFSTTTSVPDDLDKLNDDLETAALADIGL